MAYIGKAFLSEHNLEQLLWNIIVLECLLGGSTKEVKGTLKRRVGNILGATTKERSKIQTEFSDLYDFRSDLVHGRSFDKKTEFNHLQKARIIAQRVMSWFVDYLLWVDNDFREREISYEHYPRREELLMALDVERPALNRLGQLLPRLPTGFPSKMR
jgi:hypothetical protein